MKLSHLLLITTASLTLAAPAMAQPNPAPAAQPANAANAPGAEETVKVLEIKGKARYRSSPDAPWQPLKVDSPVTLFTEFQTAAHSEVLLQVGPNSQVTLKGLGTLTVASVKKDESSGVIQTRLGQKYGRVHVEVQRVGELRNDYTIATPGMVLAVKGSGGDESSYGPTWYVEWQHGTADQTYSGQTSGLFAGDQTSNQNPNPTTNRETITNLNNNFYPGLAGFVATNDPHNGYSGSQQLQDLKTGSESSTSTNNLIDSRHDTPNPQLNPGDHGPPPPAPE